MDYLKDAEELLGCQVKESFSDQVINDYQKNFTEFCEELEKLSKKYGVVVKSVGGIEVGEVDSVKYDDDLSSGDLTYKVKWK